MLTLLASSFFCIGQDLDTNAIWLDLSRRHARVTELLDSSKSELAEVKQQELAEIASEFLGEYSWTYATAIKDLRLLIFIT